MPGPITKDSWAAMTAAVGVSADAADGQPARLSVPGIEPVDGTVEFVVSPSFVGMRTDDAMYMLIHGYNDMVFATAHYFDDRDPSTETEAWQNWLGGLAAWSPHAGRSELDADPGPDRPVRFRHRVLPRALAAAAHDEQVAVTHFVRAAPTEMIATMVSSVEPRPIVSPCQATLSRPSR
jgi:hypothetical protein